MDGSANFIPLGSSNRLSRNIPSAPEESTHFTPIGEGSVSRNGPRTSNRPPRAPKVIGATPEDRKRIAREVRLAAKKEKKKGKQEAKAARKLNGILHRRMNRNDEKYVKNKERNHTRAIDLERRAIQTGAVRQAEALAAIHDLSGKMFNVGEQVVMPDGQIKSKDRLQELEETKRRRAQTSAEYEEKAKIAKEKFQEAKAKLEAEYAEKGREVTPYLIQRLRQQYPVPTKISKKQLERRELYAPRPPPKKPVIPEGFPIPEGEEDLLALWDITDEDILKRLNRRKKEKTAAARALRRIQKEKKKFNRAMKMLKKQCARAGVLWEPEKAKKEVLGMIGDTPNSEDDEDESDAGSDAGSDSDSGSGSDSDDESEEGEEKPKTARRRSSATIDPNDKKAMALKIKGSRPKIDLELLAKANEFEENLKARKKAKKDKRKQDRIAKAAKEAAEAAEAARLAEETMAAEMAEKKALKAAEAAKESADDSSSKKRKRSEDENEDEAAFKKADKKAKKAALIAEKSSQNPVVEAAAEDLESESEDTPSSKQKRDEGDADDDSPSKQNRPKKKAKKASKTEAEETKALAKRERKAAKKAAKEALSTPSNDDRLDRAIAEREAAMSAKSLTGAEQWNPEALDGDEERKSKFMRLLGAGKGGEGEVRGKVKRRKDVKGTVEGIQKVQSDLERQYETGMKMKHDGGSKRRGLGA